MASNLRLFSLPKSATEKFLAKFLGLKSSSCGILSDRASYYVAILYEIDPTPVEAIDYLKKTTRQGQIKFKFCLSKQVRMHSELCFGKEKLLPALRELLSTKTGCG